MNSKHLSRIVAGLACLAASVAASEAGATYSIVAADSVSGQVGVAVTSCVGMQSLSSVYSFVPGVGAVAAQARQNLIGKDYATLLLARGSSPSAIVDRLSSNSFDIFAPRRQYGIVTTRGAAAAWTGARNGTVASDAQGDLDGLAYSVQGNILTSTEVITQAEMGFRGDACDLPARLMAALEAGALNGQGDQRCITSKGTPSDAGYLRVDNADGSGPLIELDVADTAAASGVEALRAAFDTWRASHACAPVNMCPFRL